MCLLYLCYVLMNYKIDTNEVDKMIFVKGLSD